MVKIKIKIKDKGTTKVVEQVIPDKDHLQAQIKFPHKVEPSKKVYKRRSKYGKPNN